jgi:phosphoadenylyl-sulfate reductase (thioredoxin)
MDEFEGSLVVLTSFQREGIIIVDLALEVRPSIPVVTIDTGRLPAETLAMIESVEARYGIQVERIRPDAVETARMVDMHGYDLFREGVPLRMLCCNVRKVRPLEQRLRSVGGYFTGIRREQNSERAMVEVFERSSQPVRVSPLADWTAEEVLAYTLDRGLPEHPLYEAGYTSIGCDPCTRAVSRGEGERAGRWWWENDAAKECGLHFSPDGRAERMVDVLLRDLLKKTEAA